MKRIAVATIVIAMIGIAPAASATQPAAKFANCTALQKIYPGGVAKSKAAAAAAIKDGMRAPKVSAALYSENSSKDRDKDGVACERS